MARVYMSEAAVYVTDLDMPTVQNAFYIVSETGRGFVSKEIETYHWKWSLNFKRATAFDSLSYTERFCKENDVGPVLILQHVSDHKG